MTLHPPVFNARPSRRLPPTPLTGTAPAVHPAEQLEPSGPTDSTISQAPEAAPARRLAPPPLFVQVRRAAWTLVGLTATLALLRAAGAIHPAWWMVVTPALLPVAAFAALSLIRDRVRIRY
ncbi:MAG: hypothetical protein ACREJ2_16395 [Planctomycetota bacterium]